jgi:hypothetical protein
MKTKNYIIINKNKIVLKYAEDVIVNSLMNFNELTYYVFQYTNVL